MRWIISIVCVYPMTFLFICERGIATENLQKIVAIQQAQIAQLKTQIDDIEKKNAEMSAMLQDLVAFKAMFEVNKDKLVINGPLDVKGAVTLSGRVQVNAELHVSQNAVIGNDLRVRYFHIWEKDDSEGNGVYKHITF